MTVIPFGLEDMARAQNYQKWIIDSVSPYFGKRILEFGAGTGNMSRWLPQRELLYITEADEVLFNSLQKEMNPAVQKEGSNLRIERVDVTLDWVDKVIPEQLDTVVSFNVLEHIESDLEVLNSLCRLMRKSETPGAKRIISFVPAHQWLHNKIDKKSGHFRRYNVKRFADFVSTHAADFHLETFHFNFFGMLGWYWIGKMSKHDHVRPGTVDMFEKLCPFIRGFDDVLHRRLKFPLGQSILAVMTLNK